MCTFKKIVNVWLGCSLLLIGSLGVADAAPRVLKYGEPLPTGHVMTDTAEEFARLVKEKSQGHIEIQVFPGGQLGGEREQIQATQMGTLDVCRITAPVAEEIGAKKMGVFALPYIFRDRTHFWKVLTSPIGTELLEDMQASGTKMKALGYLDEGARHFFFRAKPVTAVAELKGLKIRVPQSKMMADMMAAFGAVPMPTKFQDLYKALKMGVVDGAENPPTGYLSNKFYEVAKYYTLDGHTYSPSILVISEATWQTLSPEAQKALQDAALAVQEFNKVLAEQRDQEAFAQIKAQGAVITDVPDKTAWQAQVKSVYDTYGAKAKALIDQINAIQ